MENKSLSGPLANPLERSSGDGDGQTGSGDRPSDNGAADEDAGRTGPQRKGPRRRRPKHGRGGAQSHHIPSRADILATLARLPSLVAVRRISTAQSGAIVQALTALLRHLPEDAAGRSGELHTAPLRDALRQNPDLMHALGPLLSDEQLAELSDDEELDDNELDSEVLPD